MVCKNCGIENEADARFCVNCGTAFADAEDVQSDRICPWCDSHVPYGSNFCTCCYADITNQPPAPASQSKRIEKKKRRIEVGSKRLWNPAVVMVVLFLGGVLCIAAFKWLLSPNAPDRVFTRSVGSADPALEARVQTIAAKFVCSCGSCGELPLDTCTCDRAVQERQYIRTYLQQGQSSEQAIAAVRTTFGGLKPEFESTHDSSASKQQGSAMNTSSKQTTRGAGSSEGIASPVAKIAAVSDRSEVFSHFQCPCGQCGIDQLKDCDCSHPRGAREVKAFVDQKIGKGKYSVAEIVTEVEKSYGGKLF